MLTIPTAELTGTISDVLPFAFDDDTLPEICAVHLEWDGEKLHAQATDRYSLGWCTWSPDDDPAEGPAEDDLFTEWGSGDNRWALNLPRADAAELVKVFKLPAKEGRVPLYVDVLPGRLTVRRKRSTLHSDITTVYETAPLEGFPDLREILDEAEDRAGPVDQILYSAKRLALFAKVRAHGPLQLSFTDERRATRVSIGTRFTGAVMPQRPDRPDQPEPADEPDVIEHLNVAVQDALAKAGVTVQVQRHDEPPLPDPDDEPESDSPMSCGCVSHDSQYHQATCGHCGVGRDQDCADDCPVSNHDTRCPQCGEAMMYGPCPRCGQVTTAETEPDEHRALASGGYVRRVVDVPLPDSDPEGNTDG